jgi:hypothetical protein
MEIEDFIGNLLKKDSCETKKLIVSALRLKGDSKTNLMKSKNFNRISVILPNNRFLIDVNIRRLDCQLSGQTLKEKNCLEIFED